MKSNIYFKCGLNLNSHVSLLTVIYYEINTRLLIMPILLFILYVILSTMMVLDSLYLPTENKSQLEHLCTFFNRYFALKYKITTKTS